MNFRITKLKLTVSIIGALPLALWKIFFDYICFDCPSYIIRQEKIWIFLINFIIVFLVIYVIWSLIEKKSNGKI